MIVVLSGEGKSDLGYCNNNQGECRTPEFVPGPMTWIADKIIADRLRYSMLEATPAQYIFIGKTQLLNLEARRKEQHRKVSLTGKKRQQETGSFHINAWMLGAEALRIEAEHGEAAIAILFRDCDGTRASPNGLWDGKWEAMTGGFLRARLGDKGVPMLPKPKSESWLLCAAQAAPYQHCGRLESMSGNDGSPNSVKDALEAAHGARLSAAQHVAWLDDHGYDHAAVADQMPSFSRFKQQLNRALTEVGVPEDRGN
ncbi:hypothetical protein [Duganella aceris]|uniref:Uncharacterized protein n=1 Tax=Duganella aceris TaxID=2703883 RepID=A0ABX0FFU1_9BURK|nr:hypothetical protein [Duganella aceris]NGZ83427.1 hypothetical protein [Duganella aceris]